MVKPTKRNYLNIGVRPRYCTGFYHVISRGVERRNVFLDGDDFDKFVSLMSTEFKAYNITTHAYCLMTNHYHLLIETKEPNISDAMKRVNSLYSIYFNNIGVRPRYCNMPRKERITHPGFYHVISRGVERRNVFLDGDDFDKFVSLMSTNIGVRPRY